VFAVGISGLDLGLAIASPAFGLFVDRIGYSGVFGVGALLVFGAAALFILRGNPSIRSSLRFAGGMEIDRYSAKPTP
jgi:predicted MFS family arabinose efflux permease